MAKLTKNYPAAAVDRIRFSRALAIVLMALASSTCIHAQEPLADANRLGASAHRKAAAIDSLDRFYFRADCATRFDLVLAEPTDDAIANFKAAFDAEVGSGDWHHYLATLAWDRSHWVGGEPPNFAGKPYLIHFWATWCGACKSDYEALRKLSGEGHLVVGLHAPGTPLEDVKKAVADESLNYPTLVLREKPDSANIGDFPAGVYPHAIIVGSGGKVIAHGSLDDQDTNLLQTFRSLGR